MPLSSLPSAVCVVRIIGGSGAGKSTRIKRKKRETVMHPLFTSRRNMPVLSGIKYLVNLVETETNL